VEFVADGKVGEELTLGEKQRKAIPCAIMSKFEKAELVLKLLIAIGAGVLIWEWFEIIH
jgi:hypothetical protein